MSRRGLPVTSAPATAGRPLAGRKPAPARADDEAADALPTARRLGLAGCGCCGLVVAAAPLGVTTACPRCGTSLHATRPHSLQRTSAFLIAAMVLYVPANLLPVMSTASVLGPETHTILGGIVELWNSGSWELAVIVLVASIVVPILKIAALVLLSITAQRRSRWHQPERARLYRLVETVGHWSMLDVFVVVLLVGMVRFGALASVRPEAGLLAFGAVVVMTMLASSSFDPKLIWPEATDDEP